jgi:thiol-disulfide isomerase/thioredoxin
MTVIQRLLPISCALGSLMFGLGCGGQADRSSGSPEIPQPGRAVLSPEEAGPAPAGQTEEPDSNSAVSAKIAPWPEIEAAIQAQRQSGKVVVVDYWTTFCPPCRKEFPELVKLHRRLGQHVVCISVALDFDNLDSVESCHQEALKFLEEQQATFQNYVCSTAAEDVFGKLLPDQSVPAVYVYNQQGEQVGHFPDPQSAGSEEFTYAADVIPLVESLLQLQ